MGISVGGLATGIDTDTLVSQLIELERRPIAQLQTREADFQVQLTTFGSLQSLLSNLKSAAADLERSQALTRFSASVSDADRLSASADATATPGTYNVGITQLAQNQKLKSAAFAGSTETVGAGTIHLRVGNHTTTNLTVGATDSIADVVAAINAADAGITATLLFDGNQHFFTLTATETGLTNAINLTVTDSDGNHTDANGLSRMVYDAGVTENLTQTQEPRDAIITVDGVTGISRPSNTINDVIPGVTLTLQDTPSAPEDVTTVTIGRNTSVVREKIETFLKAYNEVFGFITERQHFNPDTRAGGPLLGDSTANLIRRQLQQLINLPVTGISGNVQTLSDLGVSRDAAGQLTLSDTSALDKAMSEHFADVIQFFTQTNLNAKGFGMRVRETLDGLLAPDKGALTARQDNISLSIKRLQEDMERKERRVAATEERLRAQFHALESLVNQLRSTEAFLSQQITGLQNLNTAIANR